MMDMLLNGRPLIAVLVSMIAAGLILILGNKISANQRESITMIAAVCKVLCVFSMISAVMGGESFHLVLFEVAGGINLGFKVDSVGMVFACVASALWLVTSIYSIGYMREHKEKNQTGYFSAFALCVSGAIGICFSANLLTFFVFYELLTLATYPLITHYRNEEGKRSGRKYLIYSLGFGQLMFAGIIYVYATCGTLEFRPGGFIGHSLTSGLTCLAFALLIVGGAVKAGLMPLHSWLPSAMVAPTPVSALLHAVAVVKAGAFCVIRIVGYTFGPQLCAEIKATEVLAWMAVATIILASFIAMQKDNLKARLAYSTVGQLAYIILGASISSEAAMTGAIYHIVAHAVLKITLFMCAGAIFVTAHKDKISQMKGIGRKMPVTMTAFTVASLGIAGMPFTVGFVSKMNIIQGAAEAGQPLFIATLIASALLSLTYLIPIGYIAFGKTSDSKEGITLSTEADPKMLIPIVITASLSILLGIMPNFGAGLLSLAESASAAIFGGTWL
ncbi:multicomponent Na+:H+ antiporter subunit D [Clostridiales Family XIII bacterium PM5-7]